MCSPQDPRSEHLSHHLHKNIWTCKIFYVNTPMGLIISSLSDCLTAESWECWANGNTQPLTTRGLFDQRSSGVCWLLQRINITTRGSREPSSRVLTRNQERRRQSWSAQCTGRVLASLKADETLQVCWVCNYGLGSGMFVFSSAPLSPLFSCCLSWRRIHRGVSTDSCQDT